MATAEIENPTLTQELRLAVSAAALTKSGASRQLPLGRSDLPSIISNDTLIKVKAVKFSDLKMGDIVCVRQGGQIAVRRFVKLKMTNQDTYLLVAREGCDQKETLSRAALVGKVDETRPEGLLTKFWGRLTEYGTHKPFGLFAA